MHKKISIIIVTYKSQVYMNDCLDSIQKFLDIEASDLEVIIVDNSSGKDADEMKMITESHPSNKTLSIRYLHNVTNLGYGHGNNVGIKASSGEIICIMNPDVRFGTPLLKDALEKFKSKRVALVAYKQLGGYNYSFYMKPECRNRLVTFITKIANKLDFFLPKFFYLSGAFFFVDRKMFEMVKNFDENIFMYFEEPDIANRLQDAGYKIKYDNSKTYFHLVGDRLEWSELTFAREMDSLLYYLSKYGIDQKKYLKLMLSEVKIKLKIAQFLNDKVRIDNFKAEITYRQNHLNDSNYKSN